MADTNKHLTQVSGAPTEPQTLTLQEAVELAVQHHNAGDFTKAESIYNQVLQADPNHPVAWHLLGVIAHQRGDNDRAVELIERSLSFYPNDPNAYSNLGNVLKVLGRLDDAVGCYEKALSLNPNLADVHNNLGLAFHEQGKDDAITSLQKALAIDPHYAAARINLSAILFDIGRMEEALANLSMIFEKEPDRLNLNSQIGYVLNALGRYEEALYHFNKNMNINSEIRLHDPKDETSASISKARIKHDIEQFQYLASLRSEQSEDFDKIAKLYTALESEVDWPSESHVPVALTEDQRQRIRSSYSIPLHLASAERVSGSTLNENLNISGIAARYTESSPNLVVIDDFLTPSALSILQRFLLESTIWFHFKENGYIGAHLDDGLACPLLLEIAEDLRQTFSSIFQNHKLLRLWAYKYDSQRPGINVHADDAAVNVNFWVTPNSANLDPDSGGLVLYHKAAPEDWPYDVNYTGDNTGHIEKYLEAQNSDKTIIPYAENRAIIFNSSLFHETDTIRFKPGYENRRISITLLFGRRTSRPNSKRSPILRKLE